MFGEIHLCEFPFTSGTASKRRPALVLFDLNRDVIICRVTSMGRSGASDVVLNDWASAGLLFPSTVRLDRLVTAEKSVLVRRLGSLGAADREAVRTAWNKTMRL